MTGVLFAASSEGGISPPRPLGPRAAMPAPAVATTKAHCHAPAGAGSGSHQADGGCSGCEAGGGSNGLAALVAAGAPPKGREIKPL